MSEKTAADYARELLEVTDEWAPAGDIDPGKLAAALAAAEERGRRRGVEEAALIADAWLRDEHDRDSPGTRIRAALAPRDSAPKHKDWCALFGNPEAGKSCDCRGERK